VAQLRSPEIKPEPASCHALPLQRQDNRRSGLTDAVKRALENELRRLDAALPLRDRLRPIQNRVLARPPTGQEADKAFYDALSGDP